MKRDVFLLTLLMLMGVLLLGCDAPTPVASGPPATSPPPPPPPPAAAEDGSEQKFKLPDVLPPGRVEVELLTVQSNPRGEELGKKLNASVASHGQWFANYTRDNAKSGKPLPYHPNMGLTEEEYREFLGSAKGRRFVVAARGQLVLKKEGDFVTVDGGANSPISQIRFDLTNNRLHVSAKDLGPPEWQSSERTDIPSGPYEGYAWRVGKSELSSLNITATSLDIFRLKNSGKILWHFQDRQTENGTFVRKDEMIFQYSP